MTSNDTPPRSSSSIFVRASAAAASLREQLQPEFWNPAVAIVCGSGLGNLQDALKPEPKMELPYSTTDGMPLLTTPGHEGKFVFGLLQTETKDEVVPAMLLVGRAHFYEGHSMEVVTYATRLCHCLGVGTMIFTNAAGGLNPSYKVGDLVLLQDHLNLSGLTGFHPLRGQNEPEFGVRFPPLSDAYDLALRRRMHAAWKSISPSSTTGTNLHEGVYVYVSGPSYETRAECRMLRLLGADVVGMSTVPEVVTARHCGMKVVALSLVTNNAVLDPGPRGDDEGLLGLNETQLEEWLSKGKANHEEVLQAGREAAQVIQRLIVKFVDDLARK